MAIHSSQHDDSTKEGFSVIKQAVQLNKWRDKLESLRCQSNVWSPSFLQNLTFPPSLKKTTITSCFLPWKDTTIVVSLPNLEVLKLKRGTFLGPVCEPIEGEFVKMKFLLMQQDINLKFWRADTFHFPSIQRLIIKSCHCLMEIPYGIGEIPTLESIKLHDCSSLLETSAKQIQEEQLSFENEGLQGRNTIHINIFHSTSPIVKKSKVVSNWTVLPEREVILDDFQNFEIKTLIHRAGWEKLSGKRPYKGKTKNRHYPNPSSLPIISLLTPFSAVYRAMPSYCLPIIVRQKLLELEPRRSGNFVMVANKYAEAALWEKATNVRNIMRDKGLKRRSERAV
ncbi:Hypothetical predicted protein [Olea europaea subsp. europaea]|uniref:Disease resistance protein n=1 Tax=Olea europaea subsp. europaea TaxID=158383 RepID=A0A8S0VCC9_OLEEU|nr:Hypothetical predicted protein [Olea europaea subsp. europaea]